MADVVARLWGLGEIPDVAISPEPEGHSSLRSHPARGIPAGRDAKPLHESFAPTPRGDATAGRESASEEGSPSGTDSAPERSQCGPLLESCAAMRLATRRLDSRNEGLCVIDVSGAADPAVITG